MFNPFFPFSMQLLNAFIVQNKKFFVRQTFDRGKNPFDDDIKGYFMVSHYDDKTAAATHFDALKGDPNRFLYNWNNQEHQEKLKIAAGSPKGYKIYSSVFQKDWEKHITDKTKAKIRMYVAGLGWRPSRNDGLTTDFYLTFGEVYIRLKYKGHVEKIKFEEIEKLS